MKKLPIISKAYKIDFSKIEEGFLYSEKIVWVEKLSKAKTMFLKEMRYEDLCLKGETEEVTYLTIPVIRSKENDIVSFEGQEILRNKIDSFIRKRNKVIALDQIKNDKSIQFCYITKRGYYYRDNYKGYTPHNYEAGFYSKDDAISEAISCDEVGIVPINIEEHNNLIREKISYLEGKFL